MSKMVKIIVVILVLVAGGVGASMFLMNNPDAEAVVENKQLHSYNTGDCFVTNIKGSTRLLKTSIDFAVDDESHDDYLTENNGVIRDVIIFTLRKKTEAELRNEGSQDDLRKEIVKALKSEFDMEYLETVYFSEFVLQ